MITPRKIILILLILTVSFALSSCSVLSQIDVPKKSAAQGDFFSDDFSASNAQWSTYNQPGAVIEIKDGKLRVRVDDPYYDFWSTNGQSFTNVEVEINAEKVSGPDNNNYGLICRYVDSENYYAFLISSDGYYGILRVLEGNYQLLSSDSMQESPVIKPGSAINHLRADCVGTQLVFFVNGEFLTTVEDAALIKGQTGVIVGTFDEPGVEIHFDDFTVQDSSLIQ